MVKISLNMLSGAIYNGLNRYYIRANMMGAYRNDYVWAVRKAYVVANAYKLPILEYIRSVANRELHLARLPIWWNVIRGKEVKVDLDEIDIFDIAEVSYLGRMTDKIVNIGDVDAQLIIYLKDFIEEEELRKDPVALENFARVFPYAWFGELFNKKELEDMRSIMYDASLNVDVPNWVRFVLSGDTKHIKDYDRLWDKNYWMVIV